MVSYRNDFAHFKPKLSGITESEIWIIYEVAEVIHSLALECGNILYTSKNDRDKVRELLKKFSSSET